MRLRSRLLAVLAVAAVAMIAVVAAIMWSRQEPARPVPIGTALGDFRPWSIEVPLQVGQEIIDLTTYIENTSSEPIRLQDLTLKPDREVQAGELVEVHLVDSRFDAALHNAEPPVMRRKGRCVLAEFSSVEGFVLEPGEQAIIAVHVRANRLGRFRLGPRTIFYEQGGQLFREDDEYLFIGDVRSRWRRDLAPAERHCRDETTLLPAGQSS